ncbi:MAG: UDP-N-acetylmuramate--L-alanine ligase [Deltaproteobacteria bacterium]|nr:UDP-N-acetylmuramate--L-alanine ligase [Deltaproteobacteria bacterium]MBW2068249.1 UDP-N-acetylmuramate--L-alanine ligase [Deltaproteobacteria bacterium]
MEIVYPSFRKVHFIGIGGIGMSGIAEVLLNMGYEVSGSDVRESETTRRLRELGARITIGHSPDNIWEVDVVVYSSAIRNDNVELQAAKRIGTVPVIPRAEMLAELMRMKHSILVAGAHGKTTTTSMIGAVLHEAGMDPTVVIGGRLNAWGTNARMGNGNFFVAEADESDGTFLLLSPSIAVVTNIDREHMDYYRDLDHIIDAFVQFVNRVPFYGLAVVCYDDKNIRTGILPRLKRRYLSYGFHEGAELRAVGFRPSGYGSEFDVVFRGEKVCSVRAGVPGRHNVLNALAVIGVGWELGLDWSVICRGLAGFSGVQRRLQIKGETHGIVVMDDYGHHPTEIKAVLETLRLYYPERRIVVVFQPHRYSRTHALEEEFMDAFDECDLLITTEIYPAGEEAIPGVTGERLTRRIVESLGRRGVQLDVEFCPSEEDVLFALQKVTKEGDLVITLGAGNVWQIGEKFLKILQGS